MILHIDRTAMRREYGLADGQANPHPLIGVGFFVADVGVSIKDISDPFRIDTNPIILNMKCYGGGVIIYIA